MSKTKKKRFKIPCFKNCFKPHNDELTNYPTNPLPIDIERIIISKLDLSTLFHFHMASPHEFGPIIQQLKFISTTIPTSIFLHDKKRKYVDVSVVSHPLITVLKRISACFVEGKLPFQGYLSAISWSFSVWLDQPRLSPSGRRFFRTLVGLERFQLQLPPTPFLDHLISCGYWFRWDARLGTPDFKDDYLIIVVGDILEDADNNNNNNKYKGPHFVLPTVPSVCHIMYHLTTMNMLLGDSPKENFPELTSFVCKDVGKNGRLEVYVDDTIKKEKKGQNEGITYVVPTVLTLDDTDINSTRLKNTWLWYLKWKDISRVNGGRSWSTLDEMVNSCVEFINEGREKEEEDLEKKELRDVVTQIISHNDKRLDHRW